MHPLLELFLDAADGRFPPADGSVSILPSWRADLSAVVSFTAHTVILTDTPEVLRGVRPDAYGAALHPGVLATLARYPARIGVIDATLAGRGRGDGPESGASVLVERTDLVERPVLVERTDLDDHPRVKHARALRDDVLVYGAPAGSPDAGLVTLATGLAGRRELSVELMGEQPAGTGRRLIEEALRFVPAGEAVFAAVAPGNARSLRAFLAVGFTPVGSEVIIEYRPIG